jgi:hypothetical protein
MGYGGFGDTTSAFGVPCSIFDIPTTIEDYFISRYRLWSLGKLLLPEFAGC